MQVNWSEEGQPWDYNTTQTHHIKWKLVYWCCTKKRFSDSEDVENMIFLQSNMSYAEHGVVLEEKKRKHLGLAVNDSSLGLTFTHDAVLPTHTSPCRGHISPSDGAARCACSRPARCVYLHGGSWYHRSDTQPESGTAEAAFTSSLFDLLLFIQQKRRPSYST